MVGARIGCALVWASCASSVATQIDGASPQQKVDTPKPAIGTNPHRRRDRCGLRMMLKASRTRPQPRPKESATSLMPLRMERLSRASSLTTCVPTKTTVSARRPTRRCSRTTPCATRPALPPLELLRRRQHRARRDRLPRGLRDRRFARGHVRLHQRAVRDPARGVGDLPHVVPDRLLLGEVLDRHGPDHPRRRLRLLRWVGDVADLRELHLHLLRARGLDHGPGPAPRARAPAVARATSPRRS